MAPALVSTLHEYDHLYDIYLPIAIGVFVVVAVLVAFALLRYRRAPERAARWHEANRLEAGYALLLACVAAFLLYETFTVEHQVDTVANLEKPALTIDVTASRWEWAFYYPAYRITVRSGTTGDRTFAVPTNVAVRFNLSSVDVIHAIWIPALRYKHDLIPGRTMHETLTFTQRGTFPGQCAVFCGLRHSEMLFRVAAVSPAAFASWASRRGGPVSS